MKKVSIREAKKGLRALIDSVKAGASVLITERGQPVARLEPLETGTEADEARLARLVRDGIVRPARVKLPKSFFTRELPKLKDGASVVEALLEERREGR